MNIRRNKFKLKSLKLSKIAINDIQPKKPNLKTSLYKSLSKPKYIKTYKKDFTINSTEIQDKTNPTKKDNQININNITNYNKNNKLFYLNNKNKRINLYKSFNTNNSNNITLKCFSVPQTLNYYGQNYIKRNVENVVMKMNKLLLRNKMNELSLPKNPNSNIFIKENKKFFKNKKTMNIRKNILGNDFFIDLNKTKKKNKISLYELEKKRQKEKYQKILMDKFAELEECEKKFNIVIEDTLIKLNDEEKNLHKS